MTLSTLGTFTDEYVTLSKSEYDSLIQKMHSVSTSYKATLTHLGIFCLASSSPSSWIIGSSVSTPMTDKSAVFFTFHTIFAASFIVFAAGNSKHSIDISNLTSSLALTDVNSHVSFNLVSMSRLT